MDSSRTSTAWPVALLRQYPASADPSPMAMENEWDEANIIGRSNSDASGTKSYDNETRLVDWSASTVSQPVDSPSPNEDTPYSTGTVICSTKSDSLVHFLPTASFSPIDLGPQNPSSVVNSGQPITDASSQLKLCAASFGVKTLNVAKQGGDPPTGTIQSDLTETYKLNLIETQAAQGLLILGKWSRSLEATTSPPNLDNGKHLPSNLQRAKLKFLILVLYNSSWRSNSRKDLPVQQTERQLSQTYAKSQRIKFRNGNITVPHSRRPLEDSNSMVYDMATPGSAYSATASSSFIDHPSSDTETVDGNFAWSGTPDSDEQNNLVFPILDTARTELVERVMVEFHSMMDQNRGVRSQDNSTGSDQFGISHAGGLWERGSEPSRSKRKFEGDDDREPLNHGRGDGSNQIPRISDKADSENSKFVCPYFKRNFRRHRKYSSCAGPGWDTVHRVRKSLIRIKGKKESGRRSIVFCSPDDDESLMPSPYEFANYEVFLDRELPQLVRRELKVVVSRASGALEDQLKSQLVEIVRNCQAKLFRSYQQSNHNVEATGEGNTTRTNTQEFQRPSANATQFPGVAEDDLAAFFPPPLLPKNELLPSLETVSGNPRRFPPRNRSRDLDSGYGSHNPSSSKNQGSSPVRDNSECNEQAGMVTHMSQISSESDSYETPGSIFEALQRGVPWDDFDVGLPPEHILNEISPFGCFQPSRNTSNFG
ncbi:hypothetical protein G7Y89_g4103 [Cudoniella acicularis]|uniref:Uncharacterized protein n=1 Tax=Cudoniella acicularis TaxID=354080 RepID=A0A8H4RQX7_9HELO|nr:hypothetical protein G7Y89_g4103 [Cudoniella acicularis]